MLKSRSAFLADLLATLAADPAYAAALGADTDVTIASNPVHPSWGSGVGRVDYTAALKVVEAEHIVYFWESLKQRAGGASTAPGSEGDGPTGEPGLPPAKTADAIGPGSQSWAWGYGTLRARVEEVAARHGFALRVVLTRASATW